MSLADSSNPATFRVLTRAINEFKTPLTFLRNMLGGGDNPIPAEDIEYEIITRARTMAPFTKTFAEGVMIGNWSESSRVLRAPNIRIKRPFTPLGMFQRGAGTVTFAEGPDAIHMRAMERRTRDLLALETDIQNTEEYMLSQFLQGGLTYSDAATDSFAISLGRSGSNNLTLSVFWNDATPADVDITADLHTIKRLANNAYNVGIPVTDAVLGEEAATAFNKLAINNRIPGLLNATSLNPYIVGSVDFTQQFNKEGVIWLGRVSGINFWEYSRSATLNGTSVPMVRAKYAEFFSRDNSVSERSMVYAAIPDVATLKAGTFQGKRFAKSWEVQDPSAEMLLVASRPMPLWKRPDSTYSVKVVSG